MASIARVPVAATSGGTEPEAARDRGTALPQLAAAWPVRPSTAVQPLPPAPDGVRAGRRMVDSHGRTILDLRISITDRCNFRCVYCMEPDVRFAASERLMTAEEIVRVSGIAEGLGVRSVRITGGEPTLHMELEAIIGGIRRTTGLAIAMTTNGSLLSREAVARWKRAGLDRITISIDSLRPERFAAVTRSRSAPADVLRGIEACLAEGLLPVKLNAVLVRGVNDDEGAGLASLARRFGIEVRFIEYMPLDSGHAWDRSRMVPAAETQAEIEALHPLLPTGTDGPHSTSRTFRFADGAPGTVGFIAPVTSPFCGACSRLRITADGHVRPCLFSTTEWGLLPLLRGGSTDAEIERFLIDVTWTKRAAHGISSPGFVQPARPMSAMGG